MIKLFLQEKAGKITEINHIDKPDKLHLAGRVNRVLGHAVWSEAERRTEPSGKEGEGGRESERARERESDKRTQADRLGG